MTNKSKWITADDPALAEAEAVANKMIEVLANNFSGKSFKFGFDALMIASCYLYQQFGEQGAEGESGIHKQLEHEKRLCAIAFRQGVKLRKENGDD